MNDIRPLEAADIPAVALLFQRVLRQSERPVPASLVAYLHEYYLAAVQTHPDIVSQVYVAPGGNLEGFIGIKMLPMTIDGRPVRAALCSSLVVANHLANPLIGARLIRAYRSGPQDISLSETASATTTAMWRSMRGLVLPGYSLDWLKVINPLQYATNLAFRRLPALRLLVSALAPLDRRLRAKALVPEQWGLREAKPRSSLIDRDIPIQECADLIRRYAGHYRLTPAWSQGMLEDMLQDATTKSWFGKISRRAVTTVEGQVLGIFIYHTQNAGPAQVLQVLAEPGKIGHVLDRLFEHASENGIAALRGRADPTLLGAMTGRHFVFSNRSSTIATTQDPAMLAALNEGSALITGFAGETWSRLNGNDFD